MAEATDDIMVLTIFHFEDGDEMVQAECGHGSATRASVHQGDVITLDGATRAVLMTHNSQVCGLEPVGAVSEVRDEWPSVSMFIDESRKDLDNPFQKIIDFIGGPGELQRIQEALEKRLKAVEMAQGRCECDPQLRIATTPEGTRYTFAHDEGCPEIDTMSLAAVDGYTIHD